MAKKKPGQYEIKPGEIWTRTIVRSGKDGSSGGCAACSHIDGEDESGTFMLDFWTDGADPQGAGDVLCPTCYRENCPGQKERDAAVLALARKTKEKDGEIEFDDTAVISEGDDNGAYVQAWVWIPFDGTTLCRGGERGHPGDCEEGCPELERLSGGAA